MIQEERIVHLNGNTIQSGQYVLYWMQASQRVSCNHSLEYAIRTANELQNPLVVYFGLTGSFPGANLRHYTFMIEGLREVEKELRDRDIRMVSVAASPDVGAITLANHASILVTDRGYLAVQKAWRNTVASSIDCPMIQVETDVIVPVATSSHKEEYSASTIRTRINRHLEHFLTPLSESIPDRDSMNITLPPLSDLPLIDIADPVLLEKIHLDRSVNPVDAFLGGTSYARKQLTTFITDKLDHYHDLSNHPELDLTSRLSPYLHFGQISPLEITLRLGGIDSPGKEAFLEQLIIRRELAMNFVEYNPGYDSYLTAIPEWARNTLGHHRSDPRAYLYSLEQFENAATHDPYWNAAQNEMLKTGHMHNYMRMYWCKKIIEWTATPEEAYDIALHLNNKYQLDGRDPNGFAGISWSFGKHDRAWKERAIFGKVRYMNDRGLERKFQIDRYVKRFS